MNNNQHEFLPVVCPEHEQTEFVQVVGDEIRWCSRVAGRPSCAGTCLSPAMRALPLPPTGESTT